MMTMASNSPSKNKTIDKTSTTKMPSASPGLCEEQIRMNIIRLYMWWSIIQIQGSVIQNKIYVQVSAYCEPGSILISFSHHSHPKRWLQLSFVLKTRISRFREDKQLTQCHTSAKCQNCLAYRFDDENITGYVCHNQVERKMRTR